jgi:LPXTG-motif cell wall-anchored protein
VAGPRASAPLSATPTASTLPNTGAPDLLLPGLAAALLLLGGGLLVRLAGRRRLGS